VLYWPRVYYWRALALWADASRSPLCGYLAWAAAFYAVLYVLLGPARPRAPGAAASRRRLRAAAAPAPPALALHFATGALLAAAAGYAVYLAADRRPAAAGYGAAGGAALSLSLLQLGADGSAFEARAPRALLLRPLPLLVALAAGAAEGFQVPVVRAARALLLRLDARAARRLVVDALVLPHRREDGASPSLQAVSGATWLVLLAAAAAGALLVVPLRFRAQCAMGGPFPRRAAGGALLSRAGLVAVAAVAAAVLSVHEAARTRPGAVDGDETTTQRRAAAVLHFYALGGYAVAALLACARELALEPLQLFASSGARGAALDLNCLAALALAAAAVLMRAPTSLADERSRVFQARAAAHAALAPLWSRLARDAAAFAEAAGGRREERAGDGLIAGALLLAALAEAVVDALARSSLVLAPLVADVAARGGPRMRQLALTVDVDAAEDGAALGALVAALEAEGAGVGGAAAAAAGKSAQRRGSASAAPARAGEPAGEPAGPADGAAGENAATATFFLSRAALSAAAARGQLAALLAGGHELGLLLEPAEEEAGALGGGEAAVAAFCDAADAALAAAAGEGAAARAVQWARPAGGARAAALLRSLSRCGLGAALWSVSLEPAAPPAALAAQLGLGRAAAPGTLDPASVKGAIVRLEAGATPASLRAAVAGLREAAAAAAPGARAGPAAGQPFRIATLSELCPGRGRDEKEAL